MTQKYAVIYGRVSTSSDSQILSLSEQTRNDDNSMYSHYLEQNNYKIAQIFQDTQSGTSEDRKGFLNLLEYFGFERIETKPKNKKTFSDGQKHYVYDINYDILNERKDKGCFRIVCKNTSRWTRTGDITITKKLKENGIYIYFLEESIDTEKDDIELVYKILSHLDMNKSQDTSRKVLTGFAQSYKNRRIRTNKRITGYDLITRTADKSAQLLQNDESIIIKRIFELYTGEKKLGVRLIRKEIKEEFDKDICESTIKRILKNEKYAGYVNIEKKWDTGEVFHHHSPKQLYDYQIEKCDNIPNPIIDLETYKNAQEIMKKRSDENSKRGRKTSISPYYHKVICGRCKSYYVNNQNKYNKHDEYVPIMVCGNKRKNTIKVCNNRNVKVAELEQALNRVVENSNEFWKEEKKGLFNDYLWLLLIYGDYIYNDNLYQEQIQKRLDKITNEVNTITDRIAILPSAKTVFDDNINTLLNEYDKLKNEQESYVNSKNEKRLFFNIIYQELLTIDKFSAKTKFTIEELLEQDIVFYVHEEEVIVKTGRTTYNKYLEFAKYSNFDINRYNINDVPIKELNKKLADILNKANIKNEWKFIE